MILSDQKSHRPWPAISIVTPSFNQGRFIEETIRSVLLQSCPHLEYIVMDGGSSDETTSILKKYEPWLSHWVSEKDRGQSHAINKGMALASGDILAFLNSDDIYLPGALASVAVALAGKSGWCTSDAQVIDELSRFVHYYFSHVPRDWVEQISRIKITCPQPCTFWTRDLWQRCGPLDEEMFFSFDCDLFCTFLRLDRITGSTGYEISNPANRVILSKSSKGCRPVRILSPLAAMRRHGESKTALHKDRMERDDAVIWRRGLESSGWAERFRARLVRHWARSTFRQRCKGALDALGRRLRPRRSNASA